MNRADRIKVIKSLGHRFKESVRNVSPFNIAVVVARMKDKYFHEIDASKVYQLTEIPPLNDGEWYCPAILDGNKDGYRYVSLPPETIFEDEKREDDEVEVEYFDSLYHEYYKPESYDFNWGYNGQGLRQLIVAYRKAETVWIGDQDTTGNISLDNYLAYLKAIDEFYPLDKKQPKENIKTSPNEKPDFEKLEDQPSKSRDIANGIPLDLVRCNRRFDRLIPKLKKIKSAETWALLEEVFQAGQYVEKFHHPNFLKEFMASYLSMDLGKRQPNKIPDWKNWVDYCLKDNPDLKWEQILDILDDQGVLKYKKEQIKFTDYEAIKLSTFKKTVSQLRRKYKVK